MTVCRRGFSDLGVVFARVEYCVCQHLCPDAVRGKGRSISNTVDKCQCETLVNESAKEITLTSSADELSGALLPSVATGNGIGRLRPIFESPKSARLVFSRT